MSLHLNIFDSIVFIFIYEIHSLVQGQEKITPTPSPKSIQP